MFKITMYQSNFFCKNDITYYIQFSNKTLKPIGAFSP